jgi:hypothetical protein
MSSSSKKITYISCVSDGESLTTNILYRISRSTGSVANSFLTFFHEYGNGSDLEVVTSWVIPEYSENHICMTRDVINKVYKLYINGEYHSQYSYANNPEKATSLNTQCVSIGKEFIAASSKSSMSSIFIKVY